MLSKTYIINLYILLIFSSSICAGQNTYNVEKLIVCSPDEPPMFLPLSIGHPNPFSGSEYNNNINGPTTPFFDVDNEGNLLFQKNSAIWIFSLSKNEYYMADLYDSDFNSVHHFSLGPGDELYVCFARKLIDNSERRKREYKISKFIKCNNKYILDSDFYIPEREQIPGRMSISPDGLLYIQWWGNQEDLTGNQRGVFNRNGSFLKVTEAVGKAAGETEIILNDRIVRSNTFLDVKNATTNSILISTNINGLAYSNFKCLMDNSIFIADYYKGYKEKELLSSNNYYVPDIYEIIIADLNSSSIQKLNPYDECKDDKYSFLNVGGIAFNYNGDIYAFIVYHDNPGEITGNEKIVLYRWNKK